MRLTSFSRELCGMMEKWENIIWRWRIMCKKDELYEKITENLFVNVFYEKYKNEKKYIEENPRGYNSKKDYKKSIDEKFKEAEKEYLGKVKREAEYYLQNNNDDLDKSYYVMQIYKNKYDIYKQFEIRDLKTNKEPDRGRNCYLYNEKSKIEITGETLNSFDSIYKMYTKSFETCSCENKIVKMCFHSMTTIGNLMPCVKGFNYNCGRGLDIAQDKITGYIWVSYGGKISNETSEFIKNHYLQDFVDLKDLKDGEVRASIFINKNSENKYSKEDWNRFFFRSSKAMMKRSYRILKTEEIKGGELSEEQEKEFEEIFIQFCNECRVKDELVKLKEYLSEDGHEDRMIKDNELEELEKLIKELK